MNGNLLICIRSRIQYEFVVGVSESANFTQPCNWTNLIVEHLHICNATINDDVGNGARAT